MPKIILKFPAICKECGAQLRVGDPARYYGRNGVYGVNCHESPKRTKIYRDPSNGEVMEYNN